eukprot:4455913-Pyramimonas_sp.AAC.1
MQKDSNRGSWMLIVRACEVYSPVRVARLAETMGRVPKLAMDSTAVDESGNVSSVQRVVQKPSTFSVAKQPYWGNG